MNGIGRTSRLEVIKEVDFGVYLEGKEAGEILLPLRYVPQGCRIGDWLDVFVYLDSEDRIVATTEKPFAELGECAHLRVVDVNDVGAFMDWGLAKDLLVPFREQRQTMRAGRSYTVYIFEDDTGRICGSARLDDFLPDRVDEDAFMPGEPVSLQVALRTPIGFKAVIDSTHLGMIHEADALVKLNPGMRIDGFVKKIRADGAIDLSLQPPGDTARRSLAEQIMTDLAMAGGASYVTDKSSPQEIFAAYQVSKANYKKTLGKLFKDKKILIEPDRIVSVDATRVD